MDNGVKPLIRGDRVPQDGDTLVYDAAQEGWVPAAPVTGGAEQTSDYVSAGGSAGNLTFYKTGDVVVFHTMGGEKTAADNACILSAVIPEGFRPFNQVEVPVHISYDNGSTYEIGFASLYSNGNIEFYKENFVAPTTGNVCLWQPFSAAYTIATGA